MKKNKKEFSKKIFNRIFTLFIITIIYSMALMWKTNSVEGLVYLISAVSGLTATCVGFYFWKAKMENMIKLSKENQISMEEVKEIESTMSEYDVQVDEL